MKDRPLTLLFVLVAILAAIYLHRRALAASPAKEDKSSGKIFGPLEFSFGGATSDALSPGHPYPIDPVTGAPLGPVPSQGIRGIPLETIPPPQLVPIPNENPSLMSP